MENNELVKKYFEETAKEFDEIYDNKGDIFKRIINKVFRKSMYERIALTIQECVSGNNKTVLDIGCGSGRIVFPLAEKGIKVTAIDYSPKMIELAKEHLRKYRAIKNIDSNIEFICGDFMKDFNSTELFDITLALGVFDYIKNPLPFLEKMERLTKEKMIASYPDKFAFQAPLRKIWLSTKKCPVYFYSKKDLETIYHSIGITDYEIIKMQAVYLVKANLSQSGQNF